VPSARRVAILALLLLAAVASSGTDTRDVVRGVPRQAAGRPPGEPPMVPPPVVAPLPPLVPVGARTPTTIPAAPPGAPLPLPAIAAPATPAAALPSGAELLAVGSRKGQSIALINPATGAQLRRIDVGVPVVNLAAAPDGQTLWAFDDNPGEGDFQVVDLVKGERQGARRLRNGPRAAAFSSDGLRAFVALGGTNEAPPAPAALSFVNANGDEFGHVDIGRQVPGVQLRRQLSAVVTAAGQSGDAVYVAGRGSGAVWALDAGSGKLLAEIEVGGGPLALLADPPRRHVYAIADTTDELVEIDADTQRIVARVGLPGRPAAAAQVPGGPVYVVGPDEGELWVVVPDDPAPVQRIALGHEPVGVALSRDGSKVYVANRADGTVAVVDAATQRPTRTFAVGDDPTVVAVIGRPTATPAATTIPTPAAPTPTPTIVASATAAPAEGRPEEHLLPGMVSETFVPDAAFPVPMAFAPDQRLFYGERLTGKIRVVANGRLLPEPFYSFGVSDDPETGLLGIVLDPAFAQNHYVYAYYTQVQGGGAQSGGPNGSNQVVRLTDVGNKGTNLTRILRDLPSGPEHNAGTMRFGPDGKLYVSIGDCQCAGASQDLGTPSGKILRVNADGSIPPDNPFVNQPGKYPAVWAYGLRNPFSFDFHPVTHALFADENGPGDNDELNVVVRGGNYGWPPSGFQNQPGLIDPIAVMNPTIGPTGLTFYTGDQIPEWKNDLFYCDWHQGQLRRIRLAAGSFDRITSEEVVKLGCSVNVVTGPDGALYWSDPNGIYRIRRASAPALPAVAPDPTRATATATPALPAGTRAEDRDVDVTLSEWKLVPSRTRVPAGKIRLTAENVGVTPHALQIVGQGVDVSTPVFNRGEGREVDVDLPPGAYRLICPIPGHAAQGMAAELQVVGG